MIFTFDKKRDLEKYCREVIIHSQDFVLFILECEKGRMPFRYLTHFCDYVSPHLIPSELERDALTKNGLVLLRRDALKASRKIFQLFKERKWLVGHMFYSTNYWEWHFFCFDQRDIVQDEPNHWSEGPHIHFINWLWSGYNGQSLWK